jgi:signal transduction histidine kinase
VRFDDRIATVLAQPDAPASAVEAKWRQLVDLVAQQEEGPALEAAAAWLRAHRRDVPAAVRREVAQALSTVPASPAIVLLFGEDEAGIAAPVIAAARLPAHAWTNILPRLGSTARSLLRHRRDLDPAVHQALAAFGAADFALEGRVAEQSATEPSARGEAQIRELVARIEAFRKSRETAAATRRFVEPAAPRAEQFRWEAGPDGILNWVEGAPREALVGQSLALIAEAGEFGVDGQAAGAFERRAPFRDARLTVAGSGAAAGDWRISGVPFFEPARGTFLGYRGSARRPRVDEVAAGPAEAPTPGLFGTELPADSLRQLIHELRTPLNAIIGFAEMIEGQHMGAAGESYRARAGEIVGQASKLLSAVDDLDTAARIETRRLDVRESSVDAVALLCRLHDSYERVASQRDAKLAIEISRDVPPAGVDAGAAERMFARLLAATIGLAREGETISATMSFAAHGAGKMLCLAIDRPQAIAGIVEAELLDPAYSPEGDWPGAPALGLGFALRLVRNLAQAVGGALDIGERRFFLYLPPALPAERSTGQR